MQLKAVQDIRDAAVGIPDETALSMIEKCSDIIENAVVAALATVHALENWPVDSDKCIWVVPPFEAEAVHATVFDVLDEVIERNLGIEYDRSKGESLTGWLEENGIESLMSTTASN